MSIPRHRREVVTPTSIGVRNSEKVAEGENRAPIRLDGYRVQVGPVTRDEVRPRADICSRDRHFDVPDLDSFLVAVGHGEAPRRPIEAPANVRQPIGVRPAGGRQISTQTTDQPMPTRALINKPEPICTGSDPSPPTEAPDRQIQYRTDARSTTSAHTTSPPISTPAGNLFTSTPPTTIQHVTSTCLLARVTNRSVVQTDESTTMSALNKRAQPAQPAQPSPTMILEASGTDNSNNDARYDI